ncbi:type II secretion system F family protein [Synechococcus sp. PCC 7336]|uniref:type II secretion system F family protein n=1 Tax=Synechococcus sp. PCC 7336 TaxID=195250 RepID=UPI00034C2507|nr:type II secretion system F family protein [Synechococcus sp. PCC 7336]
MPQFKVLGLQAGRPVSRTIKATSLAEARASLRRSGVYVRDISEVKRGFDLGQLELSMGSIEVRDKAVFSRQFAALINAGVSMVRSLTIMTEQTDNPKMRKYLTSVKSEVESGKNLSDAIRPYPDAFDGLYCAMVQAGEVGGVLDEVLQRLAKLLEDVDRLQRQIKSAMTYPVTVLVLAVLVFLGMVIFILPTFESIYEELGGELPAFTQFFLTLSEFLRSPIVIVGTIVMIVAGTFAFKQFYRTPAGRESVDALMLKLPLFGDLIRKSSVARFCRTFGSLSRSGVPVLTSLEIVRDTAGNRVIANAVDSSRTAIAAGNPIAPALGRAKVFPVMAVQMISVGEETGELDQMLEKTAEFYELEVEQAVKSLTSLMEPIMIAVLGGMVGTIIVAMYLPMFNLFELVG